jgi:hypothetical protein
MTTTDTTAQASDSMRNGVDTATLFATLDAVKQAPQAAQFQFRAHNQWISGTHNRSTIADYFGVGEERSHERTFVFDADPVPAGRGRHNYPVTQRPSTSPGSGCFRCARRRTAARTAIPPSGAAWKLETLIIPEGVRS